MTQPPVVIDNFGRSLITRAAAGVADIGGEVWIQQAGFSTDPALTGANEVSFNVAGISRADVIAGKYVMTYIAQGAAAARIVQIKAVPDVSAMFTVLYFDAAGAPVAPDGLAHVSVREIQVAQS